VTELERYMKSSLGGLEQEMLSKREAVIEEAITVGRSAFITVGAYLTSIRDASLYREYGTFEEYVDQRWGLQRAHAYRLIESARVVTVLTPTQQGASPIGDIPQNEAQTRELARIKDGHLLRRVWREITTSEETITAAVISTYVDRALRLDHERRGLEKPESQRVDGKYFGELVRDLERLARIDDYLEGVRYSPSRASRELERIDAAINFLTQARARLAEHGSS